tara:strand:+ start:928 stop:1398 length:471 start_codon:yes stop_codon:yes gene_type:complete
MSMEQSAASSQSQTDLNTDDIKSEFMTLLNTLSAFKSQITMISSQVKSLEKKVKKRMKVLEKQANKNKNKGNRKASGFAIPTTISKDLCKFMDKPEGTKMARTEVTKYIIQYIKDHNLPQGKVIKPDKQLKALLKVDNKEEVTYFNIQKYMNKHFV